MIHDLLEVTRAGAGKLSVHCEPFSVEVLLEQARGEFSPRASARGHEILVQCPKPVPVVDVDPARVRQILSNLVDNAIKFTRPPGTIVLEVRQRDPRWVCVSVSDTGCGVSSDARERIFERLHQERALGEEGRRGLGLGLYICRELVKAMGGRIWVEPREEGGSIFLFTLPVASGSPGAAAKSGGRSVIAELSPGCDVAPEEEIPGARS
jgi:signal transduction histidine kinase